MPRMSGIQPAQFPEEIVYRGLASIITAVDSVTSSVVEATHVQESIHEEITRIRLANELILGQEVKDVEEG